LGHLASALFGSGPQEKHFSTTEHRKKNEATEEAKLGQKKRPEEFDGRARCVMPLPHIRNN